MIAPPPSLSDVVGKPADVHPTDEPGGRRARPTVGVGDRATIGISAVPVAAHRHSSVSLRSTDDLSSEAVSRADRRLVDAEAEFDAGLSVGRPLAELIARDTEVRLATAARHRLR